MSATITLTYSPPDGSADKAITVRAPEWGNRDAHRPTIAVQRSLAGRLVRQDRGGRPRVFEWDWPIVNVTERADLDYWFQHVVGYSMRWFKAKMTNTPWPDVLRAGAVVGGVTVKAGTSYTTGQRVVQDEIIYPVRLADPEALSWTEVQDGFYALSMTLDVIEGSPPANVE